MREASREKVTPEHVVIDEAIRDKGDQYTVFSIVGTLHFNCARVEFHSHIF